MKHKFFAIFFSLSFVTLVSSVMQLHADFDPKVLASQEVLKNAVVQQISPDDDGILVAGVLQDRQTAFLVHVIRGGTQIDNNFPGQPSGWTRKESTLLYSMSPNTGSILSLYFHPGFIDVPYYYISIKIDQTSEVREFKF